MTLPYKNELVFTLFTIHLILSEQMEIILQF